MNGDDVGRAAAAVEPESEMERARKTALAQVAAELAQFRAEDAAAAEVGELGARGRSNSESVVFSVRLSLGEAAALRRRAAVTGIGVTVLARNLIRMGLARGGRIEDPAFAHALGELERAMAGLRALA